MIQANNVLADGLQLSWEKLYGIDAGALTNATRKNLLVEVKTHQDFPDGSIAEATYFGTGALTLSEFANLPQGSRIWCPALATPAVYLKTARKGTATFKYTAINT
jgi:hypothetical protein